MKRTSIVVGCALWLSLFTASSASATYLTFDNVWNNPVSFTNIGFWDIPHTVEIGELWSSDYGGQPPDAFPLDITNAHPLLPGQTYVTPLIPWLPDTGFLFTGLGVGGGFGFTGLSDADPGHTVIIPGTSSDVINVLWLTGGPGVDCLTCGTVRVMEITFHEGSPSPVPEPSSFLLFTTGLGLGIVGLLRSRSNAS